MRSEELDAAHQGGTVSPVSNGEVSPNDDHFGHPCAPRCSRPRKFTFEEFVTPSPSHVTVEDDRDAAEKAPSEVRDNPHGDKSRQHPDACVMKDEGGDVDSSIVVQGQPYEDKISESTSVVPCTVYDPVTEVPPEMIVAASITANSSTLDKKPPSMTDSAGEKYANTKSLSTNPDTPSATLGNDNVEASAAARSKKSEEAFVKEQSANVVTMTLRESPQATCLEQEQTKDSSSLLVDVHIIENIDCEELQSKPTVSLFDEIIETAPSDEMENKSPRNEKDAPGSYSNDTYDAEDEDDINRVSQRSHTPPVAAIEESADSIDGSSCPHLAFFRIC